MGRSLKVATLATAMPLALMSIVTLVIGLIRKDLPPSDHLDILDVSALVNLGFLGIAFLTSLFLYFRKERDIATRIGVVSGIGFVVWMIIFAVVSGLSEL
jgi:hypothetical protein